MSRKPEPIRPYIDVRNEHERSEGRFVAAATALYDTVDLILKNVDLPEKVKEVLSKRNAEFREAAYGRDE